jgi:hypothetical protein
MRLAAPHLTSLPVLAVLSTAVLQPPSARAIPSYARQTGLSCSACHYTPPELNPAGRQFKLNGYIQKEEGAKMVKTEAGNGYTGLDLLQTLPISVVLETSFTSTKSPQPGTQNGTFEFPQDFSLFLAGGWTAHVGSFLQVTYNTQNDHFSMDNTDIRVVNKGTLGGKELAYGLTLNNNPTVEDLWNSTPAWGYPWIAADSAPTPNASPIISSLGGDVAGIGGYGMWDGKVYLATVLYRSDHVGAPQPNPGTNFGTNIRGVAPYWRAAYQVSSGSTQFMLGTFGMHMSSTPGAVVGLEDTFTDVAVDFQLDQTINRRNVLSFRGNYIHEDSTLNASFAGGAAQQASHHLDSLSINGEYHFGNRYSLTLGYFDVSGTADPLLYPQAPLSGNLNGDPKSNGFIGNVSFWPSQNWQIGLQYTGYTNFNGGSANYDGAGRNASANNTFYLVGRFLF